MHVNRTFTSLEWVQLCCTRVLEWMEVYYTASSKVDVKCIMTGVIVMQVECTTILHWSWQQVHYDSYPYDSLHCASNGWVRSPLIALQAMLCLASCATRVSSIAFDFTPVWSPSIAPQAMQCLASCATRVKQVSLIAFDCTPGHAVLATRVKPVSSIAFDCTPGHAVLGVLCYPSQTGEFDRLRLHVD